MTSTEFDWPTFLFGGGYGMIVAAVLALVVVWLFGRWKK